MKWLLILSASIQTTAADQLVGRWDTEARSRGGLGAWMTLSADHTCTQTTGAMVDGTWQLNGDRMIRKISEGPGGSVQTEELTMTIADRALTLQEGQNRRQLTRVGQPAAGAPVRARASSFARWQARKVPRAGTSQGLLRPSSKS